MVTKAEISSVMSALGKRNTNIEARRANMAKARAARPRRVAITITGAEYENLQHAAAIRNIDVQELLRESINRGMEAKQP